MKRESKSLTPSLERRLSSYALAASAAGVSLLALAHPAEAKIVYTPAHVKIAPHRTIPLDLNHDRIADFIFVDKYSQWNGNSGGGVLLIRPVQGNEVWATSRGYQASALMAGVSVGPKGPFSPTGSFMAGEFPNIFGTGLYTSGHWTKAKNRYLGLRFTIHRKTHFGWARLNARVTSSGVYGTLTGYAYETVANKPITAGKTHGKDVITLEPASLGQLAQGALGKTRKINARK